MGRLATLLVLGAVLGLSASTQAQPVERVSPPTADTAGLPTPRGALYRSLAVPGWGQVYNRQPLKVPVVVGGLGALVYTTVWSHNRAGQFRGAALFLDCTAEPPRIDPAFCVDAARHEVDFQRAAALTSVALTSERARTVRDGYRRQRDIFILLTALAYGLQALDAYVAAQLADFDVGEDLSLGVTPGTEGLTLTLRWSL